MSEEAASGSLTIPAELGEIDRARAFVKERLRNGPLVGDELFQFDLALFEILVNVVRYSYPSGGGEIRLTIRVGPNEVRMEIRDHGIPFDPRAASPPIFDEILKGNKKGGLGIHLAKQFSDEMTYRREGAENVLVLRKSLSK